MPITEEEKQLEKYEKGVSCHHCFDKQTPEQRKRYSERERQMQLAKSRGESHIGSSVVKEIQQRRDQKKAFRQQQRDKNS